MINWPSRISAAERERRRTRNSVRDKYSLSALGDLYRKLDLNRRNVSPHNQGVLIETIRAIAEVIIYDDQHTDQLFEYFCEKNMLALIISLLDHVNCGSQLTVQIIQSVGILIQNIKSETSLYYTLSNNHINRIISHKLDFKNEEIATTTSHF